MICPTCSSETVGDTLVIHDRWKWAKAPCPCPTCEAEARRLMYEAGEAEARRAEAAMLSRIMGAIGMGAGATTKGLESTGNGPGVAPGVWTFAVLNNLGPSRVRPAGLSLGNST